MIRALVFDFDGLILDTEVPVYRAWAEIYEDFGQRLELELWQGVIGRGPGYFDPLAALERRLGCVLDREAIQARRRRRELELVERLTVQPGVREWRAEAMSMGVRLGVASSSSRAWVTGHLRRLGLDEWDCIRCRDDVARTKPAPDVYLSVLECLGSSPGQALAVEDSEPGVAAAKAAGMHCVAVPSAMTAGHDLRRADLVLRSLAERSFAEVAAEIAGISG
ncbi:MAG TPA: HAD-IA family hydrolase [Candidatus Dormibacteraeota bacterium]|nr:HAD-IA family hydrolase [Candidatus Dormibacteraeota bacterium]